MITNVFVLAVLLSSFGQAATQSSPTHSLTVCEVLQHLSDYSGQMIEVRGPWNGGDLWSDCHGTSAVWPNVIGVGRFGVRDYDAAVATAKRLLQKRGTTAVATIVGRLDTREIPAGAAFVYGDPKSFRAQLVTTTIKDISTEDIIPIDSGNPISVCEALRERSKYDGKIIEIRGRFYGNSLGDQCTPMRTDNLDWPSIVQLEWPSNSSVVPPATWNVDVKWYDRLVSESARVGAGSRKQRPTRKIVLEEPVYGPALDEYLGREDLSALATVVGRFDSHADIDFKGTRLGYGHLGQLPARLVIIDVRDLAPFKSAKPSR